MAVSRCLSARALTLLASLPFVAGASCPAKPDDCTHGSTERCAWERGQAKQAGAEGQPSEDDEPDTTVASREEATVLDQALTDMIEIMGAGLEWDLVDERARALCAKLGPLDAEVAEAPAAGSKAWSCPIFALDINGQPLDLEASHGVLSLSAEPLDADQSDALFGFARARFDDWCAGGFEELDGGKLQTFQRCALPEGPYLVLARFPRDLEADQWQVSIAVVDAG